MDQEYVGQKEMRSARHRERLFRIDSYPKYIWHSFRESKFYQRTLYFWVNFRRYRLISRIFTTLATALTIIGTGASVLIFAGLCLLLLPLAALLAGGTMLLGFFRRGYQNRKLTHEVSGRTVYLFFPDELNKNTFSAMTMRAFSHLPHSTVFVISPYSWSSKGLGGNGFYINARQEDEHLFLLRRHYFFFFRKLLDFKKDKQTVVIL